MTTIFNDVAAGFEEWAGFLNSTIAMLVPTLLRHGTEEQKHRFVPALLSGELAFCQLFSEPGAGSDLAGLATRATLDGDEFIVNGQKVWNSQAQFCDWGFLLVRTDPERPKHQGISLLLVDMSTPGIDVRPLVQMTGSSHFNEVFLSDVRVPVENVVGDIDGGWTVARTVLANESSFIGGRNTQPTSRKLTELARHHDCLDDGLIRQGIAELYSRELAQRQMNMTLHAALRRGGSPPFDPGLIKLFAAESKVRAGDLATTIAGAAAIAGSEQATKWTQLELMGRYSISIGGGTNEVLRNNIAERSLGLPREPRVDKDVVWTDIPC
jgi:alkylation response protein AidB-like acyl-CoA dehydrogenase